MAETGTYSLLDSLGDTALKLAEIYEALVRAGIITRREPAPVQVPVPYVPEPTPWYKSPYLPVIIGIGAVGSAGAYYAVKSAGLGKR